MADRDAGSTARLQQQFGNLTVTDGALGFMGSVSGDVHINRDSSKDTRKNIAEGAFNSASKQHTPTCLVGTREDVLDQIRQWADGDGERRMYWLKGMAGTGKSTIALTIACEYHHKQRLGASFFFQRGGGDLASAQGLAATISNQLEELSKPLKKLILAAASSSSRIDASGLSYQWEKLVMQPLMKLQDMEFDSPILFVIDALDECDNKDDVRLLVNLLARVAALSNVHVRVLITSRPDINLTSNFENIGSHTHQKFVLHDIEQSIVDRDIEAYYRHHLKSLNIDKMIVQMLVDRSHGLFIHAATVCRYIRDGGIFAEQRLSKFLELDNETFRTTAEKALDDVYSTILNDSLGVKLIGEEPDELHHLVTQILGSIVTLADTMSVSDLASIITHPENQVRLLIDHLHSVLDVPTPDQTKQVIRLVHPSFRDFLLNPTRNVNALLLIDSRSAHIYLLKGCFRAMEHHLRQDMCRVRKPGTRVEDVPRAEVDEGIPGFVQYACRYWVHHLQESHTDSLKSPEVMAFFQKHFLFWVETLAWMNRFEDAVDMVTTLNQIVPEQQEPDLIVQEDSSSPMLETGSSLERKAVLDASEVQPLILYEILRDAKRFLFFHNQAIRETPLQIYCSALVFSPQTSILRKMYSNAIPKWLSRTPAQSQAWGLTSQAVSFHPRIRYAAFSSDSATLALLSKDGIFLMDKGTYKRTFLGNLESGVKKISFCCNDQFLLCNSSRNRVHEHFETLELATGSSMKIAGEPTEHVLAVGFSLPCTLVISQSSRNGARLWEFNGGKTRFWLHSGQTTRQRQSPLVYAEFSPEGELLFVRREDSSAELWHTAKGRPQKVVADTVAFPPRGYHVLLIHKANKDMEDDFCHKADIWDFEKGSRVCAMERRQSLPQSSSRSPAPAAIFSPNCRFIALIEEGTKMSLWDRESDQMTQGSLYDNGKTFNCSMVKFSGNSKFMACGMKHGHFISVWKGVSIWDSARQVLLQEFIRPEWMRAHLDLKNLAFSSDSEYFTAVWEHQMQTWDMRDVLKHAPASAPQLSQPSNSQQPRFSDDSTYVISRDPQLIAVNNSKRLELWNIQRGSLLQSWTIGDSSAMALSDDGRLLAAVFKFDDPPAKSSWFQTIDTSTASHATYFGQDVPMKVYQLAFSGDSTRIFSLISHLGFEGSVQVWTRTGQEISRISTTSLARPRYFAVPLQKDLICVTSTKSLAVFSGMGEDLLMPPVFEHEFDGTCSASFSQDGQLLAFANSTEVCVWNTVTESKLVIRSVPHRRRENGFSGLLAFSPDNTLVAALYPIPGIRWKSHILVWRTATGTLRSSYFVSRAEQLLSFSPCGKFLKTESGTVQISAINSPPSPAVYAEESWIRNSGNDLVYIPANYRKSILLVGDRNVIFDEDFSERVLQFSESSDFILENT